MQAQPGPGRSRSQSEAQKTFHFLPAHQLLLLLLLRQLLPWTIDSALILGSHMEPAPAPPFPLPRCGCNVSFGNNLCSLRSHKLIASKCSLSMCPSALPIPL